MLSRIASWAVYQGDLVRLRNFPNKSNQWTLFTFVGYSFNFLFQTYPHCYKLKCPVNKDLVRCYAHLISVKSNTDSKLCIQALRCRFTPLLGVASTLALGAGRVFTLALAFAFAFRSGSGTPLGMKGLLQIQIKKALEKCQSQQNQKNYDASVHLWGINDNVVAPEPGSCLQSYWLSGPQPIRESILIKMVRFFFTGAT